MWTRAGLSDAVSTDFLLPLTTSIAKKHAVVAFRVESQYSCVPLVDR
jgi:hypothetical protein